jgi:Pectate lyase
MMTWGVGVLLLVTGSFAAAGCFESAHAAAAPSSSSLFSGLKGFGSRTSGGAGGELYLVNSTADDRDVVGTLRHGVEVEALTKPRWIVFDPKVFPVNTKTTIQLTKALRITDENKGITIDGRGSQVSLRRAYDWQNMQQCWVPKEEMDDSHCFPTYKSPTNTYECFFPKGKNPGPLIHIRSAKNVIITHLDFRKVRLGTEPPSPAGARLDYQCFSDYISIDNDPDEENSKYYDRIWINQSEFRDCGDECISLTHASSVARANVTISANFFGDNYKGLIIGATNNAQQYGILVSMYHNRFVTIRERQPRVEKAIAHVYNNLFEDWLQHGVVAHNYTRVMVEENVFRAKTTTANAWRQDGSNDSFLWEQNSLKSTSSISGKASSGFPSCSVWYHDCSVVTNLTTYTAGRDLIRALAGWKQVTNDVRPCALSNPPEACP